MERVGKMLRLNGGPDYNPTTERLLAASSVLQGASSFQKEREKAEKALRLNSGF